MLMEENLAMVYCFRTQGKYITLFLFKFKNIKIKFYQCNLK